MRLRSRVLILATVLVACLAGAAPAQNLDIGGWRLDQYNSGATFTIPDGTSIAPGGYLIVARFASKSAFESFYGVTLGSNVLYFTNPADNPVVPMINGAEVYELHNAVGGLEDGPTPGIVTTGVAHHRTDPEAAPWTAVGGAATPGSGVEAPDATASGLVISEVNDPTGVGAFVYEYIELYYDAGGGTSNLPPVISALQHLPSAPEAGGSLTVSCTVTDPDGAVAGVLLWWRYSGGSFASLSMAPSGGGGYAAAVSPLNGDSQIEYYVSAEDDDGAQAFAPAGAPSIWNSVWIAGAIPTGRVVLFDHAHGQDAGTDGNWRIDDNFPVPQPAIPASESAWSGQLSTWAYELYLAGHTLRSNTVPIDAGLLAGVDLLVIVEPQNPFTQAEIAAVGAFVHAGGSLFVVANHNGSDRDGDGWDSPSVFGGYSVPHISVPPTGDPETFCGALFGLHFHVKDEGNNGITGTFANVATDPANPIIHGPAGDVAAVIYHVGNVMSLWPTANPYLSSVAGHIWKDGDTGNPDVNIAAWSRYGAGKVMGYGDSSSCADGTDSEPHAANWTEAGGDNREFFLNATWWLLADDLTGVGDAPPPLPGLRLQAAPNPFNPRTEIRFDLPAAGDIRIAIHDLRGARLRTLLAADLPAGGHAVGWDGTDERGRGLPSGIYLVRAESGSHVAYTKVVLAR